MSARRIEHFLIWPCFSGKSCLGLKIFWWKPDWDTYISIKFPPEQFLNSKNKIKEIGEEIRPLNELENAIIVFDDVLVSSKSRYIVQLFKRWKHTNYDMNYLSQSCFELAKRSKKNISNKTILFNQTLNGFENIYRDIGGYDMSYDDFK